MDIFYEGLNKLKNYSFESKMLLCEHFSQQLMTSNNLDLPGNINGVMPSELEIFMLYSALFDDNQSSLTIDDHTFSEIINAIRNFQHPKWDELQETGNYADYFLMISGLTQFAVQGNISQRFCRYNYFFNFKNDEINMQEKFRDKFHCSYEQFRKFAFSVYLIFSDKENRTDIKAIFLSFLMEKYNEAEKQLIITKESYKKSVKDLLGDNLIDYYYGLKIQYLFPIIETEDSLYFPIPYLLINSTTDSLLHRLTEGEPDIRRIIGKTVLEQYLYDLYSEIENIDFIYKEKKYSIGKEELLSPDLMVIENDYCMMYDTKLSVPSSSMRILDEVSINKAINIAAENVKKIYLQIINYDQGHFKLDKKICKNNVFGIIVQLEDYYISRVSIYEKARQILKEKKYILSDEEYEFMCSNIKIVGLSAIESVLFQGQSYLNYLVTNKLDRDKWFDRFLSNEQEIEKSTSVIKSIDDFVKKELADFNSDVEELFQRFQIK